jgi:hypothetical protein
VRTLWCSTHCWRRTSTGIWTGHSLILCANPEGIKLLCVIVVDKDMNEIRMLQSHFPEVRILICVFHVIKWLKSMRAKPEFGKLSTEDAGYVDAAVSRMVYARN